MTPRPGLFLPVLLGGCALLSCAGSAGESKTESAIASAIRRTMLINVSSRQVRLTRANLRLPTW